MDTSVHTGIPLKTPNWKPVCICRGPGTKAHYKSPSKDDHVGHLLLGMWPSLKSGLSSQSDSPGDNLFFMYKWLSVGDSIWLRNGACIYIFTSWDRSMQGLCLLRQLLWARMSCLEGLQSLVFSVPCDFETLSVSSSAEFPELRGERFDGDICLRTECSKVSYSLYGLAVGFSICLISHRRKLLEWWLGKALIYEYNRMSLGVVLLLCPFSRRVVFGFSLGLWPI